MRNVNFSSWNKVTGGVIQGLDFFFFGSVLICKTCLHGLDEDIKCQCIHEASVDLFSYVCFLLAQGWLHFTFEEGILQCRVCSL